MADLYSMKETSELTGISPNRLTRMIAKGLVKARKVGWVWIFDKEEVERLKAEK